MKLFSGAEDRAKWQGNIVSGSRNFINAPMEREFIEKIS